MTAPKIANYIDEVFEHNKKSEEADYRTDTIIQMSRVAMRSVLSIMTRCLQIYYAVLRLYGYNSSTHNESHVFSFT
jgi:hypothetical protein